MERFSIGFTGTRHGMTAAQLNTFTNTVKEKCPEWTEFHYGMCVGADTEAVRTLESNYSLDGREIIGHPPTDVTYYLQNDLATKICEPKPFLDRNKDIVKKADILFACPDKKEFTRSGTWSTVRYARKCGIPIVIIMPDGSATYE